MKNQTNYDEVLTKAAADLQPKAEPNDMPAVENKREKHIGGYFPLRVYRLLKVVASENDTTTRALLVKALNMLFQLYGKPPIAE